MMLLRMLVRFLHMAWPIVLAVVGIAFVFWFLLGVGV